MLFEATLQEGQRRGYEPKGSANSSFVPVHPTSLPATAQCQLAQGVLLTFEFAEREFFLQPQTASEMHVLRAASWEEVVFSAWLSYSGSSSLLQHHSIMFD